MHLPDLVSDLAVILLTGGVITVIFKKLNLPLVLGYILAGFLIGPYMPLFFSLADIEAVSTWSEIGIIILSAKGQEQDKIRGLSIGADDYMTKPFSVSELLARVKALCRRVGRTAGGDEKEKENPLGMLTSGEFVLDENRRVLLKAGQSIELTQVEFQIMELFFRNPGIALVREKILKGVWGENYFGDVKIVDVNIRRLRMKVEDEPSHPTHIMTVWGYGYLRLSVMPGIIRVQF